MPKRPSRKKSKAVQRFLRDRFQRCVCAPDEDETREARRAMLEATGEDYPEKDIREHVHNMLYRRRQNRTKVRRTEEEEDKLECMWRQSHGICPPKNSDLMQQLLSTTSISHSDVSQWYGQRRRLHKAHLLTSCAHPSTSSAPQRETTRILPYY